MSASELPDLGKFGPIVVAGAVVVIIALTQPLSTDFGGISMNLIAIAVVAVGGLLGTFG